MAAPLTFSLSAERLDDFCRQILSRERSNSEALRVLTALQAFTANFAGTPDDARAAHALLEQHCETLRDKILEESATTIATALKQQSVTGLNSCFTRLSRSGFATSAVMALATLDPKQRETSAAWIRQWNATIRERPDQPPDAVDFRTSGIDPIAYLAMSDLLAIL